jgi:putative PIN family toxin of toxin-antitoxin system
VPRAVLDPNVLISALITPRGVSARLLLSLRDGSFEIVASPKLIEELDSVLRREKFQRYVTPADVDAYVGLLRGLAISIEDPPSTATHLSEDPSDEYLIALAREARVDALVSGDPHLLKIRALIPVRTPREFLDELEGSIRGREVVDPG